jgi:hypothetical protein
VTSTAAAPADIYKMAGQGHSHGRPPVRPIREDEEEKDLVASLGQVLPPLDSQDFSPLSWQEFYDSMEYVVDTIPVFWAGTQGPIFLLLHGAGHCALTFA